MLLLLSEQSPLDARPDGDLARETVVIISVVAVVVRPVLLLLTSARGGRRREVEVVDGRGQWGHRGCSRDIGIPRNLLGMKPAEFTTTQLTRAVHV